jgi:hypothetical protein
MQNGQGRATPPASRAHPCSPGRRVPTYPPAQCALRLPTVGKEPVLELTALRVGQSKRLPEDQVDTRSACQPPDQGGLQYMPPTSSITCPPRGQTTMRHRRCACLSGSGCLVSSSPTRRVRFVEMIADTIAAKNEFVDDLFGGRAIGTLAERAERCGLRLPVSQVVAVVRGAAPATAASVTARSLEQARTALDIGERVLDPLHGARIGARTPSSIPCRLTSWPAACRRSRRGAWAWRSAPSPTVSNGSRS